MKRQRCRETPIVRVPMHRELAKETQANSQARKPDCGRLESAALVWLNSDHGATGRFKPAPRRPEHVLVTAPLELGKRKQWSKWGSIPILPAISAKVTSSCGLMSSRSSFNMSQ